MSAKLLQRTGDTAGRDFALGDVAQIGAAADNEVRIVTAGVSRRHARIVHEAGQDRLEDAQSTNGTFLNGQRLKRSRLRHLDVITLGRDVDLIFVERAAAAAAPQIEAIVAASLEWLDGPEQGVRLDIPRGETLIGRSPSCAIVVDAAIVSKVHARLVRTADHVAIVDLAAANGTFVDARRINGYVVLESQQRVSLAGRAAISRLDYARAQRTTAAHDR